jgi:hypothetical protein
MDERTIGLRAQTAQGAQKREALVMWNKAAMLAAALSIALPAIADNPSNSEAPVTTPKTKRGGTIEQNSFSFGTSNTGTAPNANGGKAGKVNLGDISVKNPCKKPNPPHDCKRPRPPH